jgi:predicted dehydrogenase
LRGGKDVFLEKPMAITIEGCDRILHEANVSGRKLYTGHNMRFYPVIQKMRELVLSGAIGEVQAIWCRHFVSYGGDAYFRDWHAERRRTTGLLLQKGAHDIDIIHWIAGAYTSRVVGMGKLSVYDKLPRRSPEEPMPRVRFNRAHWPPESTQGYNPTIDVEDLSMILMQLENGVQATYSQCHYSPDDQRNYTIIGTRGRLENHGDHSTPDQWATVHLWNRRTGYFPEGHEVFRIPHIDGSHGGADPLIIQDFLNYLRGNSPQGATPMDARMSTAAGVLGTNSLRNGNIPLDMPPVAN